MSKPVALSFCLAVACLVSFAVRSPAQTGLQLVNHTLGETSGSAADVDLPRNHRVSFRVSGTAGAAVLLAASLNPPPANPPFLGGKPLLLDPATMVLIVDGTRNSGARIGPGGTFDYTAVVPGQVALGARLYAQAATVDSTTNRLDLSNGQRLMFIDAHRFDFESGTEGWSGGFADYPQGQETAYQLAWGPATLPAPLDTKKGAIRIQGENRSDDLFMFLKRKVSGLSAGKPYKVEIWARLASQYPANSFGIGGSPGSDVTLKAGASTVEPRAVIQQNSQPPYYIMNIDKGNQSGGGKDSVVLGHLGIPGNVFVWTLIERKSQGPVTAQADASGELWLHIGTDSGFEGLTVLYHDEVVFKIRP